MHPAEREAHVVVVTHSVLMTAHHIPGRFHRIAPEFTIDFVNNNQGIALRVFNQTAGNGNGLPVRGTHGFTAVRLVPPGAEIQSVIGLPVAVAIQKIHGAHHGTIHNSRSGNRHRLQRIRMIMTVIGKTYIPGKHQR